jgi:phenylpropionate dioxygenase-like ring-hydroxylating dioxygenase large terminal subunit
MKTVLANKRWAQKYPGLGTGPVPAEPCISPEYFDLERERVFRRVWLNVGRVEDVPEPGDYVVHDLAVCNASVLLVRGKDGVIRGFHNVCSHRGNKVVWNEKGSCPGVWACGFHSWTYNTQGELTWVPDEENFFDLKKEELGLSPITTEVWEGFLFITLDPHPRESLQEYLGGVAEQLGGGHFERLSLTYAYQVDEQANWKIALDAQNELYHLPFQHRLTIPNFCVRKDNRYTRLLDVRLYNHHSVYASETPDGGVPSPVQALAFRLDAAAPPCRLPRIGDFDFYTIFPNFVILLFKGASQDFYMTYNFWPLAVDRTRWDIKLYFPPAAHAAHRLSQDYMKCLARDVLHEDALAHEAIHCGLASKAKTQLFFQDDEIQLRHFHKVVEDYVGFYREA